MHLLQGRPNLFSKFGCVASCVFPLAYNLFLCSSQFLMGRIYPYIFQKLLQAPLITLSCLKSPEPSYCKSLVSAWLCDLAVTSAAVKEPSTRGANIPFQMHQDNRRNLPDLQFLGGVPMGLAVSAVHFVVVSQPFLFWKQPQAILSRYTQTQVEMCDPVARLRFTFTVQIRSVKIICQTSSVTACYRCPLLQQWHLYLQGTLAGGRQGQWQVHEGLEGAWLAVAGQALHSGLELSLEQRYDDGLVQQLVFAPGQVGGLLVVQVVVFLLFLVPLPVVRLTAPEDDEYKKQLWSQNQPTVGSDLVNIYKSKTIF